MCVVMIVIDTLCGNDSAYGNGRRSYLSVVMVVVFTMTLYGKGRQYY